MGSQLVPDETLDEAIVSRLAMLCMTVSPKSANLTLPYLYTRSTDFASKILLVEYLSNRSYRSRIFNLFEEGSFTKVIDRRVVSHPANA